MNIPQEVLPHYLSESERKAIAEKTRTGPIDASAGMRSTLSQAFHEKPQGEPVLDKTARHPRHSAWTSHDPDRRHNERRQKKQPVVLDTRLQQRRREALLHPSVNFEI
ncbi:MAG: hypothetical protein WCK63_17270 [Betaproteobacteria bacterium]